MMDYYTAIKKNEIMPTQQQKPSMDKHKLIKNYFKMTILEFFLNEAVIFYMKISTPEKGSYLKLISYCILIIDN